MTVETAPGSFLSHEAFKANFGITDLNAAPGSFISENRFTDALGVAKPTVAPGSLLSQQYIVFWIND